jgi:hypothetical protein
VNAAEASAIAAAASAVSFMDIGTSGGEKTPRNRSVVIVTGAIGPDNEHFHPAPRALPTQPSRKV